MRHKRAGSRRDFTDRSGGGTTRRIATDHILVASKFELAELFDVLRRPRIRALHCLGDRRIRRFISHLYKLCAIVPLPAEIPSIVPHDPKDNPIVMTAIAGQADVLCTLDHHLFQPDVLAFCTDHGVRVMRDAELLAKMRGE